MRLVIFFVCASAAVGSAWARPPEPKRPVSEAARVAARLAERVAEVRFEKTPLREALTWVGKQLGANVWVRWNVLKEWDVTPDEPITIHARDVRLAHVLWMILREASRDAELSYGLVDNILVVSTANDLGADVVTMVYDVRPLLAEKPGLGEPPRVRPSGGGTATIEPGRAEPPAGGRERATDAQLVEVLQETVRPDVWAQNGGVGTMRIFRGRLIVRADLVTQMQVQQVLSALAESP